MSIFKVQRALAGNAGDQILIYNRDRSIMGEFPTPPDLAKMMGDRPKIYIRGRHLSSGQVKVLEQIPQAAWPEW